MEKEKIELLNDIYDIIAGNNQYVNIEDFLLKYGDDMYVDNETQEIHIGQHILRIV